MRTHADAVKREASELKTKAYVMKPEVSELKTRAHVVKPAVFKTAMGFLISEAVLLGSEARSYVSEPGPHVTEPYVFSSEMRSLSTEVDRHVLETRLHITEARALSSEMPAFTASMQSEVEKRRAFANSESSQVWSTRRHARSAQLPTTMTCEHPALRPVPSPASKPQLPKPASTSSSSTQRR